MHVGIEVVTEGSPFEMGSAQGESLRQKIHSSPDVLAQLYGFRMLQPPWMPYALYRWISENRATRFLEDSLKRDFPEAHLRMKGISEQSQIRMGLLYLLHALEPMLCDVSRCAIVPAFAACSAVAVRGRRSATREPVIARNFDYLPLVQPLYTLRESRPRSGFRSLDFTIAPSAGTVDGLNEKGLCITYDYAYVSDFSGRGTAPISIVIAEALQRCATVIEAADWISSRPRWGGGILMLLDTDQLARIMSDQQSGGMPGDTSICKHSDYWNTTATLQLFPVSRRMRVAFDSACRAKYKEFGL